MFGSIKSYFSRKFNLARYELIDFMISFLSAVLMGLFFAVLSFMTLIFISITIAFWISNHYKSYVLGFGIMALIYLIVIIVSFVLRVYWIKDTLKNLLTRIAFKKISMGKKK